MNSAEERLAKVSQPLLMTPQRPQRAAAVVKRENESLKQQRALAGPAAGRRLSVLDFLG